MQDHGLERYLKAQVVYCSKKKLGCQWKGKLGDFEQHLNKNPSPEEELTGCGFVEVECRHGCGEWYERLFIDTHQNEECPQRPYSCEYCKEYYSTFEDVTEIHYAECYQEQLTATEEQVSLLKKEIHRMKIITGFPIDFKVSNKYEETLPPFFSHPHGYKMCISVDPRRYFRYRRTYVAVFAHLMRGPFDGHLKWPFRGMITIQIVNQAGDHSHVNKTFHYDEDTYDGFSCRVTGRRKRFAGWGDSEFLAHTDLAYNAAKKTQYVKDGIIIVRVFQVKVIE